MALPKELMRLSVEEYLRQEECGEVRREYVAGYVFAMSGASEAHNLIAGNVFARLHSHLRGSGCRVYMIDMKVRVEAADAFYYPDVMVACDGVQPKSLFKSNPIILIEVLSPSTELTDCREKLFTYFKLESLREYFLISQDEKRVDIYRRAANGKIEAQLAGPGDEVRFESLPNSVLTMALDEIYEDVPLTASSEQ